MILSGRDAHPYLICILWPENENYWRGGGTYTRLSHAHMRLTALGESVSSAQSNDYREREGGKEGEKKGGREIKTGQGKQRETKGVREVVA